MSNRKQNLGAKDNGNKIENTSNKATVALSQTSMGTSSFKALEDIIHYAEALKVSLKAQTPDVLADLGGVFGMFNDAIKAHQSFFGDTSTYQQYFPIVPPLLGEVLNFFLTDDGPYQKEFLAYYRVLPVSEAASYIYLISQCLGIYDISFKAPLYDENYCQLIGTTCYHFMKICSTNELKMIVTDETLEIFVILLNSDIRFVAAVLVTVAG